MNDDEIDKNIDQKTNLIVDAQISISEFPQCIFCNNTVVFKDEIVDNLYQVTIQSCKCKLCGHDHCLREVYAGDGGYGEKVKCYHCEFTGSFSGGGC